MNSYNNLAQDMSSLYNHWLATNFHESVNTNMFKPEFEDDMDIIHDQDTYNYLEESFEYTNAFDDEMFNEPPNLELYDHDNDTEEENFDSYEYARNI